MANPYLSRRGIENVNERSIAWRFAPGNENKFNKVTNPNGIISFSTAVNCYLEKELEQFIEEKVHIPPSSFDYSCYNGGTIFPDLMASHINTYFSSHVPVTSDNIITGASVTAIQSMLAFSIANEGEGVLISRPNYGRFEVDYNVSARVKIIYADMNGIDSFNISVVERFEYAYRKALDYGVRIKGLLIANPSNPLGHCYPRETLKALMAFCQRHAIHLISDEIYALSVYPTPNSTSPPFTSVLSINTESLIDPNLVHVLYGMSKDFGLAGLKIGCLITNNKYLIECCKALLRFHGSSGPSIQIASTILQHPDFVQNLLDLSRKQISKGRVIAINALTAARITYYPGGNAGFFLYINLSRFLENWNSKDEDPEFALAQYLRDHGLFLHPKEEHNDVPGWFRLVFTSMPHDDLSIGLDRLITVLGEIDPLNPNTKLHADASTNSKPCTEVNGLSLP